MCYSSVCSCISTSSQSFGKQLWPLVPHFQRPLHCLCLRCVHSSSFLKRIPFLLTRRSLNHTVFIFLLQLISSLFSTSIFLLVPIVESRLCHLAEVLTVIYYSKHETIFASLQFSSLLWVCGLWSWLYWRSVLRKILRFLQIPSWAVCHKFDITSS